MLFCDQTDDVSLLIISADDVNFSEQIKRNPVFIESDCACVDDDLRIVETDALQKGLLD